MPSVQEIESLKAHNAAANPEFTDLYYWENADEFRMIYVDPTSPSTEGDRVRLSVFGSGWGQPYRMVVGLVRPEEVGSLKVPHDWGDWPSAKRMPLK